MDEPVLPSDVARAIAARRKRLAHRCSVCGAVFEGLKQRKYCSAACRQRAYYARASVSRRQQDQAQEIPPLVQELNRIRETIMRGRHFDVDSVQLLNEVRDRYVDDP